MPGGTGRPIITMATVGRLCTPDTRPPLCGKRAASASAVAPITNLRRERGPENVHFCRPPRGDRGMGAAPALAWDDRRPGSAEARDRCRARELLGRRAAVGQRAHLYA